MTERRGLHLAIDAVGHKLAGVASVLLDTLPAALDEPSIDRVTVFTTPRSSRTFDLPVSDRLVEIQEPRAENVLLRHWWYERGLPRRVRAVGADVLLCLHSAGLSPNGVPHVTFVQRPLVYSDEARRVVPWRHRYRTPLIRPAIRRSARSAQRVLVQTPTMRDSVSRLFGIPVERIEVLLPAPRALPEPGEPAPALEPMRATPAGLRFLFVGQLVTHKNVGVAMRAMEDVRRSLPQAQLFLTGPPKHEYPPVEGVTYLGFVPDSALREAYQLASALVMPSLHETVGLPMLEAMDAGTPVLAADRAYAHDVCEDAALFFDPLDARDLAGALVEVARDQAMRRELVARGCALVARRRAAQPYRRLVSAALEAVS